MFSDNGRISQRQLGRQVTLAFLGLFIVVTPTIPLMRGRTGLISCLLGTFGVFIYLFFLVRLAGAYRNPEKTLGKICSKIVVFIYLTYLILTGGFVVHLITNIASRYLVKGINTWVIAGLIVLIAGWGTGWDLQKRARLAEVIYPFIMGAFVLLLLLAAFQVPAIVPEVEALSGEEVLRGGYAYFAAFSAVGIIPFMLEQVERSAGAVKRLNKSIASVAILTAGCLLILQAALGSKGIAFRQIPVLDMMSGVKLPGEFLERFDIIWISLLAFSLLFSIGSILFYADHLMKKVSLPKYRIAIATAVFLISCIEYNGNTIQSIYGPALIYVYTPLLLVLSFCMGFLQRRKG